MGNLIPATPECIAKRKELKCARKGQHLTLAFGAVKLGPGGVVEVAVVEMMVREPTGVTQFAIYQARKSERNGIIMEHEVIGIAE